jgi:hypothetical protein
MEVHISNAPPEGFAPPHVKTCRAQNAPRSARGARVDLEIWAGRAFVGPNP